MGRQKKIQFFKSMKYLGKRESRSKNTKTERRETIEDWKKLSHLKCARLECWEP